MARYHAHSANASGEWHELTEHLRSVAEIAERFASEFEAGALGRYAGLWHDLGKFHPDFQEYLGAPKRSRGPDHSSAGAALAARQFPLLAGLVAGHHGGLPDVESLRQRLHRVTDTRAIQDALEIAAQELGDLETVSLAESVPKWLPDTVQTESSGDEPRRRWELFLRILFSALADADFLDTESHFDVDRARARQAGPGSERSGIGSRPITERTSAPGRARARSMAFGTTSTGTASRPPSEAPACSVSRCRRAVARRSQGWASPSATPSSTASSG
ncbi:MAG: CRISPR-associated endonuclease Cas3'' [Gemmatimonadota bacterium]